MMDLSGCQVLCTGTKYNERYAGRTPSLVTVSWGLANGLKMDLLGGQWKYIVLFPGSAHNERPAGLTFHLLG